MKVISIDLGATSGRVMTVSYEDGKISYEENFRFENRTYLDEKEILRWDFRFLMENVLSGLKKALSEHPDCKSISIDTWAVDYGLLKDGKLLSDPICYRDIHSFESQKEVLSRMPFAEIYQKVGIQNLHFNTIYQLAMNQKEIATADCLLMIPDLIAYFLTGEMRIEQTNASTTSLYSLQEDSFVPALLDLVHVKKEIFPRMIHPGEVYGMLKREIYDIEIPIIACCSHDTASAVLGSSGENRFAYLSSGTWSLIGTELSHPLINEEGRKANFTNEVGYGNTIRFLKNTMGMFLINEVRKDFEKKGERIPVGEIYNLVSQSKDVPSILDVNDPLFETPGDMFEKVNSYLEKTGQEKPVTSGEMLRMIYKSMALSYRDLIHRLEELIGEKFTSILIVGGGNQATYLNQAFADASNRKVETGASEATVVGNALAQFMTLGVIKDVKEGRRIIKDSFKCQIFYPQNTQYYDAEYERYQKICAKERRK